MKIPVAPVRHIVLFKFKEMNEEEEEKLIAALNSLKDLDFMISNFAFGKTFTDRGRDYTHVLTMDFDSEEDLKNYSNHPMHIAVIQDHIKPNLKPEAVPLAMDIKL